MRRSHYTLCRTSKPHIHPPSRKHTAKLTDPVKRIPPAVSSRTAAFFTSTKLFVGVKVPSISRPSSLALNRTSFALNAPGASTNAWDPGISNDMTATNVEIDLAIVGLVLSMVATSVDDVVMKDELHFTKLAKVRRTDAAVLFQEACFWGANARPSTQYTGGFACFVLTPCPTFGAARSLFHHPPSSPLQA